MRFRVAAKLQTLRGLLWGLGLLACGCQSDGDFLIDTRSLLGLESSPGPNVPTPQYTEDAQSRGIRVWRTADAGAAGSQQHSGSHSKQ